MFVRSILLISTLSCLTPLPAQADEPVKEAIQEYLEFADFGDGVISTQTLSILKNPFIIDTRRSQDFEKSHIPSATHIEWRTLLDHLDQLPEERTIVVYCDTGVLSSKAHLILKMMGYENSRVLFGGFNQWQADQQ